MTLFVPSLCLIIAAMATLYLSNEHFEANIQVKKSGDLPLSLCQHTFTQQVALTSTLVMYTLYGSVSSTLPVNGSIKLIDIWLTHGLLNPFIVFVILVVSKLLSKHANGRVDSEALVLSVSSSVGLSAFKRKKNWKNVSDPGERFQNLCKVLMPVITMIFIAVFFIAAFLGPI